MPDSDVYTCANCHQECNYQGSGHYDEFAKKWLCKKPPLTQTNPDNQTSKPICPLDAGAAEMELDAEAELCLELNSEFDTVEVEVAGLRAQIKQLEQDKKDLRKGLRDMMAVSGDLLRTMDKNHNFLFSDYRTEFMPAIAAVGRVGVALRELLGPHDLADLTNDPEHAANLRRVLSQSDPAPEPQT